MFCPFNQENETTETRKTQNIRHQNTPPHVMVKTLKNTKTAKKTRQKIEKKHPKTPPTTTRFLLKGQTPKIQLLLIKGANQVRRLRKVKAGAKASMFSVQSIQRKSIFHQRKD